MAGKVTIIREYLSVKELSQYCGLGERNLRDLINNSINPIPSFRFGCAIRVKKAEFDEWAKTSCRNDNDRVNRIVEELLRDFGVSSRTRAGKSKLSRQNKHK